MKRSDGIYRSYLYGIKTNVRNNLAFLDDATLCYPCGHNLVFYNVENKDMQFIHNNDTTSTEGMTSFAVSLDKR